MPKNRATIYRKQKLTNLKVEMDKSTIILGNVTLFFQ